MIDVDVSVFMSSMSLVATDFNIYGELI